MANPTLTTPNYLADPGVLYYAPPGTSLPANTVSGGVFTDLWAAAGPWVQLGMTDTGSDLTQQINSQPIMAAERLDPLAYRTTDRTTQVSFSLKGYTATNLARTLNGATTVVTGSGGTTLTKVSAPALGSETRAMIGWESTDNTVRWIAYQVLNSGSIKMQFVKVPTTTLLPWTGNCEVSSTYNQPTDYWFAGTGRA
jgi:hypothetical protein